MDMTPSAVPNNFLNGTLAPGKSWSDPYSLLTLTAGTQTSSSLGITVSYDKPCATVALSASELSAAGGTGNLTVTAPSTCAWSVSSNASWISLTGTTSGNGNASISFTYAANTGTTERTSFITAQRQSLPVVQDGTTYTIIGVSPVLGSGSSQTFVITVNDAAGIANLAEEAFTIGSCQVLVAPTGTTANAAHLYLTDATDQSSSSSIQPGSSNSYSNSHCTLYGQNSSVVYNGNQMVATIGMSFFPSFNGTYTLSVILVNSSYAIADSRSASVFIVNAAPAAATPVISPSGGTFSSAQSVTIADTTSGAGIYYTTDGSTPTTSSTLYTKAIAVSQSETINAIATAANYSQSAVASAVFTISVPAAITVTPATPVAFGSVTIGSSSTQNFTVQNTGGGTLTGTASVAAPFSITSGASYSLAAGASQTVTVKFTPTAALSYSQSVTFTGGTGATGTVTGTGVAAPVITVTPATALAFGTLAIGSSATQNFTVQNTGGGTLTGTASVVGWFSITSGASYSLAAGASQTVTVKFAPGGVASYSQTVTFTGGGGTTRTVTGTGVAAQPTSTTTLTSTPNPSSFQEQVTLTATVSATSGTPTGTVTFKSGASTLGIVSLSGRTAVFTFTALPQGSDSLTAVYSGDANIAGSTSNTVSQTVTAEILGDWTWMGGSNGDQSGVYGSLGTLAAGNIPGSREGAVNWTDSNANLWLFGGAGFDGSGNYGYLNDLWELNPSTNTWAWMGGSATVPVTTDGNGGQPGVYGKLGTPATGNIPGSRIAASTWTDSGGNLWLFGGAAFDANGDYGWLNDLWEFSPTANKWTWVGGSSTLPTSGGLNGVYGKQGTPAAANIPGGRQNAASWTDSSGNFWLFGGLGLDATGNSGNLNDLWKFSSATNQWTWMAGSKSVPVLTDGTGGQTGVYGPSGTLAPGGRNGARNWTDSSGNLWLFGGQGWDGGGNYGLLNDLWKLNPSTSVWTWMGGSSTAGQSGAYSSGANNPGGRYYAHSWADANGNLWLFGGWGYDAAGTAGELNDLWAFNLAASQWVWIGGSSTVPSSGYSPAVYGTLGIPSAGSVPGGRDNGVSWTDRNGNLWLFGGEFYDAANSAWAEPNDVWEYQPAPVSIPVTSTPTFSVPTGSYSTAQSVKISDSTPGATIYYTITGTAPTTSSSVYSSPIAVSATETLESIAVAPGYTQSAVATATYTIAVPRATPTIKLTSSSASASFGASVTLTATLTGTGSAKPSGAVTFLSGSAALGTGTLNASGVATLAVNTLAVGANSITASYAGDTNYLPVVSSATTVTVGKASQTITFTAPTTPVTYGVSPISLSATASSGLPVIFTVTSGPATVNNSTLTITGAGTVAVAANQAGNSNYNAATAVSKSITVSKAAPTASLASSSASAVYGASVTLTATLTNAGAGTVAPTGTVTFTSGTTTLGTGNVNANGVASLVSTTLPVGSDSVTASYGGDSNYATAKSSAVSITVSKGAQTISFTAPTSPVTYGTAPIPLLATATSGLAVTFAVTSGPATVNGSTLTVTGKGTVVIKASQAGNTNYAAAATVQRTIVVNPGSATNKLAASAASVAYGASVTLTATLTGSGSAKPSGSVTFLSGATALGTGTLNSSGTATLAVTTLPVGSNSITASFPGDTNYAAVTSAPLIETVQTATPTIKLTASASTAAYGAAVTLTATLGSTGSAKPTGSVTFYNGSTSLGTGTLNASGVATLAVASLPVGAASLKATYGGDSNFATITSTALTVTVTKATQTITFTAPASPVIYGVAPVTLVATASSGLPVTFTVTSGPATVSNNTLTITGAGTVAVAANQAGNTNVSAAAAVSKSIAVSKATPTPTLQSSATLIAPNASLTFTVTLAGVAAGAVPTGSVTFLDGTATLGTSVTLAKGVAAYSTTKLALGKHTITVKYAGDGNYVAATSASVTVTIAIIN